MFVQKYKEVYRLAERQAQFKAICDEELIRLYRHMLPKQSTLTMFLDQLS